LDAHWFAFYRFGCAPLVLPLLPPQFYYLSLNVHGFTAHAFCFTALPHPHGSWFSSTVTFPVPPTRWLHHSLWFVQLRWVWLPLSRALPDRCTTVRLVPSYCRFTVCYGSVFSSFYVRSPTGLQFTHYWFGYSSLPLRAGSHFAVRLSMVLVPCRHNTGSLIPHLHARFAAGSSVPTSSRTRFCYQFAQFTRCRLGCSHHLCGLPAGYATRSHVVVLPHGYAWTFGSYHTLPGSLDSLSSILVLVGCSSFYGSGSLVLLLPTVTLLPRLFLPVRLPYVSCLVLDAGFALLTCRNARFLLTYAAPTTGYWRTRLDSPALPHAQVRYTRYLVSVQFAGF